VKYEVHINDKRKSRIVGNAQVEDKSTSKFTEVREDHCYKMS